MKGTHKIYLSALLQIHDLKGQPFALHEIENVGHSTKYRVIETLKALNLLTRYPRSFNHKKYQTTSKWPETAKEVIMIYELAMTMRKPYGHKDAEQ